MEFLINIITRSVIQGTALLFGSTGEIITEKSGNLNLGIPGIMYAGAISGVIGGYFYQISGNVVPIVAILICLACAIAGSLLVSLLYCFLTVTLRANQNVTGLTITIFGTGLANFFGGSITKFAGQNSFLAFDDVSKAFKQPLPFAKDLGWFGELFFSYGFMVYLAIIIAVVSAIVLKKTRIGLQLRAVGENPSTADAAGINITKYKYFATCIGGVIAGLGGLYFVVGYQGVWSENALSDCGWLAIAIVIFTTWRPDLSIPGSYLFGGLYILYDHLNIPGLDTVRPIIRMLPYVVTIIVLVIVSFRKKRETQPPASLGLPYFREDR